MKKNILLLVAIVILTRLPVFGQSTSDGSGTNSTVSIPSIGLEIVQATYGVKVGARKHKLDVTKVLSEMVKDNTLEVVASNQTFKRDPIEGTRKVLVVNYKYNGKPYKISVDENETLKLPTGKEK